jgi:hypothetical protein
MFRVVAELFMPPALDGFLFGVLFYMDDGHEVSFRKNIGELLPKYTVLQPRRSYSSWSPLWEHEIQPTTA